MFYWVYLGGCILVLAAGTIRLALFASRPGPASRRSLDWLAILTLGPVALLSVQPYVGDTLIGAGDSYYYGLQVADFITQARSGIMPVMIGQSDYAFNGNVHSVHTAPYFTHLAGLLDAVTWGRLSIVALQNLTVTFTALLAVWAAYVAAVRLSGGRRLAAWLLAACYGLSPAIMGLLALGDMFATYMTVPWLVLCWWGLAGILERRNDLAPQLLAAGTLALTWYAHAPVAGWLSLLWIGVQLGRLAIAGGDRAHWPRQALTALVFGGLAAYIVACLATLDSGPLTPVERSPTGFAWTELKRTLSAQFALFGDASATPINLGWTLWALLTFSLVPLWRRRNLALAGLGVLLGLLLGFLFPSPLSELLWRLPPVQLAAQTSWPEQRLCPLLAAGIVILAARAMRGLDQGGPVRYHWACAALALGAGWSGVQASIINRRPDLNRAGPAEQARLYSPNNLFLSRYAYVFASRLPVTFTHGWTDPEYETRLLDFRLDPAQDNASAVLAGPAAAPATPLNPSIVHDFAAPGEYLLHFDFADTTGTGEITLRGEEVYRHYALPLSGEPQAFGSAPGSARTIPLRLRRPGNHQIAITSTLPGTKVQVLPVNRSRLPVRLLGQTPFTALIDASRPGFVETPRVYLPGYIAYVNGIETPVRPSTNGLLLVPIPAGKSRMSVHYPGPWPLRAAWLLSLASLAAYPWLLRRAWSQTADDPLTIDRIRTGNLAAGLLRLGRTRPRSTALVIALAAGLAGLVPAVDYLHRSYTAYGSLRLLIELPKQPAAKAEPLLTLGQTGAADSIYVIYEDDRHIRLGFDHWSVGGPVSDPIPVNYAAPLQVEITLRGLYPSTWWLDRPKPKIFGPKQLALMELKVDGHIVFQQRLPSYAAGPEFVAIGANPIGNSVAAQTFSGRILASERYRNPAILVDTPHPAEP